MSAAPVDVLATLDREIVFLATYRRHADKDARKRGARVEAADILCDRTEQRLAHLREARAVVAEQQRILRQLAAWNRNPNGEGAELGDLCAAAELLVGRAAPGEPRHGADQLAAVAELVVASKDLLQIADYDSDADAEDVVAFNGRCARMVAALAPFGGTP